MMYHTNRESKMQRDGKHRGRSISLRSNPENGNKIGNSKKHHLSTNIFSSNRIKKQTPVFSRLKYPQLRKSAL